MSLKGVETINENSKNVFDKELLESLMDFQEKVEDCQTDEELLEIKSQILNKIKILKTNLEEKFDKNEINKILEILKLIKFNLTILEHIENKNNL